MSKLDGLKMLLYGALKHKRLKEEKEKHMKTCKICGRIIEDDEDVLEYTDNDGVVQYACKDCEDELVYCDYCDVYHLASETDMTYVENYGEYGNVCERGINSGDFTQCNDCGRWYYCEDSNIRYLENLDIDICDHCLNNYYHCENCGNWVYCDDVVEDNDGNYFCSDDCLEAYHEDDYYNEYIHDYHSRFDETLKYTPQKLDNEKTDVYFGIEVENEGDRDDAEMVYDKLSDLVCMENDGSLDDGFEIISAPLSLNKWYDVYSRFRDVFDKLIDYGHKSHDTTTCGLHIHISKTAFKNDDAIRRFIAIINGLQCEFKKLARRDSSSYLEYTEQNRRIDRVLYDSCNFCGHYDAVNVRNKTIEVRIFRGTLNIDTIYASIELLNNVLKIANSNKKRIYFYEFLSGDYLENYVIERNKHVDINYANMIDFGGWFCTETKNLLKEKRRIKNTIKDLNSRLFDRGLETIRL